MSDGALLFLIAILACTVAATCANVDPAELERGLDVEVREAE